MKSVIIALASLVSVAGAENDKPHASAIWIAESQNVTQGKPYRTVIKMTIEKGWHTYWSNPGEGGLPLSIKAQLPEGWSLGEIQYPSPIRFMTGDLPGFGYEGEILFPLTLNPPQDANSKAPELTATLSWLTCNDETCIPGKAELKLPAHINDKLVADAYIALPRPLDQAELTASEEDDVIRFELSLPESFSISPADFEVFPLTRNIIDPASHPKFEKSGSCTWTASAAKSEYLSGNLEKVALVLKSPAQKDLLIQSK